MGFTEWVMNERNVKGRSVQGRLEWAEKCGIEFELPEFSLSIVPKVPNVPKSGGMKEAACAA